jgi:hypothetical protein
MPEPTRAWRGFARNFCKKASKSKTCCIGSASEPGPGWFLCGKAASGFARPAPAFGCPAAFGLVVGFTRFEGEVAPLSNPNQSGKKQGFTF